MNKNSIKYSQGVNFSQLNLFEMTEINNSDCAIPQFVISRQAEYKLVWENLTLLYTLNTSGWVAALKETLY